MNRKPVVGRWLVYHPAEGEKDPTGAVMSKATYLAEVSIARTDDNVHVHVTIDGHTDAAVCVGIKVMRLVPLIDVEETPPESGGYCTWH